METYHNHFNKINKEELRTYIDNHCKRLDACVAPYSNKEKPRGLDLVLIQGSFKKEIKSIPVPRDYVPRDFFREDNPDVQYSITPAYRLERLNIYQLTTAILAGHTFLPAYTEDGSTNSAWLRSNIIGIDIDNGLSIDDALSRCEQYGVYPALIYPTFSHGKIDEKTGKPIDKFRMLFVLDRTITELGEHKALIGMLMTIFPECDSACKNVCRLWHGTNKEWCIIYGDLKDLHKCQVTPQQITQSFYLWIKQNSSDSNRSRDVKKFCMTLHIEYTGRLPLIDMLPDGKSIKIHWSNPELAHSAKSIKTTVNSRGQERTEYIKADKVVKRVVPRDEKKRNVDFNVIADKCYLFGASRKGEHWLYEPELVHLVRNLHGCENGKEELRKIILSHPNFYDNQIHDMSYYLDKINTIEFRLNGVTTCRNNCPFWQSDKCHCIGNTILDNVDKNLPEIDRASKVEKVSLEQAQSTFKTAFQQAISSDKAGVHIIKSSMGMGKTEEVASIGEWIDSLGKVTVSSQEDDTKPMVVIAEPTHVMKGEIGARMVGKLQSCLDMNVVEVKPKPRMQDICTDPEALSEFEAYERMGAVEICSSIHNKWIDDMAGRGHQECIDYRVNQKVVSSGTVNALLTTHDKVIFTQEFDRADIIIFDEDPTQRLIKTQMTSVEDIERLKNCLVAIQSNIKKELKHEDAWYFNSEKEKAISERVKQSLIEKIALYDDMIQQLIQVIIKIRAVMEELVTAKKNVIDVPLKLLNPIQIQTSRFISLKKNRGLLPKTNVMDFLQCDNYVVYASGKINYISRRHLMPDKKYLVLSGTADPKVCNHIFGDMLTSFVDCGVVENQGTVYQNIEASCNKGFVNKNIEEIVNGLFELNPTLSRERAVAITHKQLSDRVSRANVHQDTYGKKVPYDEQVNTFDGMWFGATEGKNDFYSIVMEDGVPRQRKQGEQPYFNTLMLLGKYVYPMEIYRMWCSALGIQDDTMKIENNIPVTRYGITNYMTTFVNKECQEVHLWLIESELRQALGRARQIRPEQSSVNVFVFNNIVLPETDVVVYGDMEIRGECKFDLALAVA